MPGGKNIKVIKEILSIQPDVKILVLSRSVAICVALYGGWCLGIREQNGRHGRVYQCDSECFRQRNGICLMLYRTSMFVKSTTSKSKVNSLNPLYKLSNREMDVARHLIEGIRIIDVSDKLNLSSSTVSTYKSRIFDKLGVTNIPDLIALFKMHAEKE